MSTTRPNWPGADSVKNPNWNYLKNIDIYIYIFFTLILSACLCKIPKRRYVALSDPGSMKFSHIIEKSPRDWEATVRQNVALTVFHTQNICHHAWKTLRTKL